jgi:hypothetical protein
MRLEQSVMCFFEGWLRRGDIVKPTMRAHDRRRRAPTGAADA